MCIQKLKNLLNDLDDIQKKSMNELDNRDLLDGELQLREELRQTLKNEEILWAQIGCRRW